MKKLIKFCLNENKTGHDLGLLLLRLLVGGMMLTHGCAKLSAFGMLAHTFPDPIGLGSTASLILILFAEVGCSLLLLFGFFTRLAILPLIFGMCVAGFVVHNADAFQTKELPLLYLGIYVVLFFTGAGRFALDHFMTRKVRRVSHKNIA